MGVEMQVCIMALSMIHPIGFYSWNYLFNNIHSAASDIIVQLELNWDPWL